MLKAVQLPQLKVRREQKRWTQEMLAEFSGVSIRTIQRLESGMGASLETAKAIAAAMGLPTVDDLQIPCERKNKPQNESLPHAVQSQESVEIGHIQTLVLALSVFVGVMWYLLSTTEGQWWLAKTIGFACVVGVVTGVIVKLMAYERERATERIIQWVLAALCVSCLHAAVTFIMEAHEERQWLIKRGKVITEVWAAIDDSMDQVSIRLEASPDGGLDALYELPMSTLIGQERWARLVSDVEKSIALPTCPPIRMEMTHKQLADWGMNIKKQCQFSHSE